jgi:hypothetical protein
LTTPRDARVLPSADIELEANRAEAPRFAKAFAGKFDPD